MKKLSRRVLLISCAVGVCLAQGDPAWRARVVDENEPGEKLIIRGRVLRTPGGAPAAGVRIMVYQTDAQGIYSKQRGQPIELARLRGEFTSGPKGEYEIVTVRPGAYPEGGVPLHIHVNLVENGKHKGEICEFFFQGDPLLKGGEIGYVLETRKDKDGTLVAVQDFALEKK